MCAHVTEAACGKELRLARIFSGIDQRALFIPLDHSLTDGPIGSSRYVDELVGILAQGGADAIVVHKGRLRTIDRAWLARLRLVVHLSASSSHSLDSDDKVLVGTVEEAVALGADAVSIHVNVGSATENRQLADFGVVSAACSSWGMPLIAMMYARGAEVRDEASLDILAHLASIAVDLGADVVKLVYSGSIESMREVVDTCPIPIIVAGGVVRSDPETVLALAKDALAAGVRGLAIGRNVFGARDPRGLVGDLAGLVHGQARATRAGQPVAVSDALLDGVNG